MGHTKNMCWKKSKDTKPHTTTNNYLEMLMDDDVTTFEQLNRLCGSKHDIFSGVQMRRRRLIVEVQQLETNAVDDMITRSRPTESLKEGSIGSKILTLFIKNKISLSLMETILSIPSELEYLESLVKVTKKKRDENIKITNVIGVERMPTICRICINKSHCSKTLHMLMEINNNLV